MALQPIDITTPQPNGKLGDPARVMAQKINANFAELYGLASSVGTIVGLKMSRPSANSLTVSGGAAYVPGLNRIVVVPTPITKSGIAVASGTWLHGYLFETSGGVADVEWVTTAPAAPYSGTARTKSSDTTRRYFGSVRSGGANAIYNFLHVLASGSVTYLDNTAVAPFLLVAGGAATTATAVSTAAVAPVTASIVHANIYNDASSSFVHVSNSAGPVAGTGYIALAGPKANTATPIPLDSAGQYTYAYESVPSSSSFQRVFGYTYER